MAFSEYNTGNTIGKGCAREDLIEKINFNGKTAEFILGFNDGYTLGIKNKKEILPDSTVTKRNSLPKKRKTTNKKFSKTAEEIEFQNGKLCGEFAAENNLPKKLEFKDKSAAFVNGYNEGYEAFINTNQQKSNEDNQSYSSLEVDKDESLKPKEPEDFERENEAGPHTANLGLKKSRYLIETTDDRNGYEPGYQLVPLSFEQKDFKLGYRTGYNAAYHGSRLKTNFISKSQSYIDGYNKGFETALEKLTPIEREYNLGKVAGRNAASQGWNKPASFEGKSELYIKGFLKAYESVRGKLTPEEIEFRSGKAIGSRVARKGGAKQTIFADRSPHYQRGYLEGYEGYSSRYSKEEFESKRGQSHAKNAIANGYRKKNLTNYSVEYSQAYNQTYDQLLEKLTPGKIEARQKKHLAGINMGGKNDPIILDEEQDDQQPLGIDSTSKATVTVDTNSQTYPVRVNTISSILNYPLEFFTESEKERSGAPKQKEGDDATHTWQPG